MHLSGALMRSMGSAPDGDPLPGTDMSGTLENGTFYGGVRTDRVVGGITLAETGYEPGFEVPPHDHAHPFFCLTLRGSFDEEFERRRWTARPSTIFYHPAAAEHAEYFGEDGGRLFNIQLGGDWLARLERFDLRAPQRQVDSHGGALSALAGRLYREFRVDDPASDLAIDGLVLALLAGVIRQPERRIRTGRPGWLSRVEALLHERMGEPMDLAAIAAEVDIHPVHMARVFKRHHGCTPGAYLRRLRNREACRLLAETDCPLARIALAMGFAGQSHFTRTFKRSLGVPPGQYRRLTRP